MNVLGNQNCALLLIDMFITENISNDFSDCLHPNCILANQLCAIKLRKQLSPSLSPSLSLSLLLLQNSSCAYLSKHFRWENWKSCTWKAKEKCLKKCFAFCQANAFAPDEAQQMCKVFRTEQQRRKSRTVDRAKYGTRKTATAAEQQQGIFIVCGWKIDVRVVLRCTVLVPCCD